MKHVIMMHGVYFAIGVCVGFSVAGFFWLRKLKKVMAELEAEYQKSKNLYEETIQELKDGEQNWHQAINAVRLMKEVLEIQEQL